MVTSLFQEAACNDLVFSRLCFFEMNTCDHPCFQRYWVNSASSCSHPFDEWYFFYYKRAVATTRSFKFTIFFQNRRSCSKVTFLVSGIHKLKDSLLVDDINCSNPFLLSVIILWEHLKWSLMPRALFFILLHLLQPSITAGGLWLIRENLKGTVFAWEKAV